MLSGNLKDKKSVIFIVLALVAVGVVFRLMPHPANFAPVTAIALVGGAILRGKMAWALPLLVMVVSDAIIGFHDVILFTWGSFLIVGLLSSRYLSKNFKFENVLIASMAAAVFFYLFSNLGVWLVSGYYQHSLAGLMQCYYNALPFFRNTFLGDVVFSSLFYGAYVVASSNFKLSSEVFTATRHKA